MPISTANKASRRRAFLAALRIAAAAAALVAGLAGCKRSTEGLKYYERGEWDRASAMLREAILAEPEKSDELMPFYVNATVKVAERLASQDKFDSAFAEIEKARQPRFARDSPDLRRCLVKLHLDFGSKSLAAGNLDLAIQHAEEVKRIDPTNEDSRALVGQITIRQAEAAIRSGKLDDALRHYLNYLRDFPEDESTKKRVAEVLLAQADHMWRRRQAKASLELCARALGFDPSSEEAVAKAIVAAEATPRVLINNYRYLLELQPGNPLLRQTLLKQLERRALDGLDAEDPERAKLFYFALYDLDDQRERRLAYHRRNAQSVADFSAHRGDINSAQTTLQEAAKAMPPLAGEFDEARNAMTLENERFFITLQDDLSLVRQLQGALRDATNEVTTAHTKREMREAVDFLKRQEDALTLVSRQRNRAVLDRVPFNLPERYRERIEKTIHAEDFAHYIELLRRYQ